MKKCSKCENTKLLDQFRKYTKNNSIFYSGQCKTCLSEHKKVWVEANWTAINESNKVYNRKHADKIRGNKLIKYWPGTTWQQATQKYNALLTKQCGVCALCDRSERRKHKITGAVWDLAIDHCHTTKKVRGLLCNACNRGLGLLGDTSDSLQKALDYLKGHL